MVVDLDEQTVLHVADDRSAETLASYFDSLRDTDKARRIGHGRTKGVTTLKELLFVFAGCVVFCPALSSFTTVGAVCSPRLMREGERRRFYVKD